MPIFNRFWIDPQTGKHDPTLLATKGPALAIEISVTDSHAAILNQTSVPIPQPKTGSALIDTGARFTAVDIDTLNELGIPPVSTIQVTTPSGQATQGVFMCRIVFPGTNIPQIDHPVTGSQIKTFGHIALIGRDILNSALLVYDGKHGMWTIAF